LSIYTASQREQVAAMTAAVAHLAPEADIDWVRASTGIVSDGVLAQRGSPKTEKKLLHGGHRSRTGSQLPVASELDGVATLKPRLLVVDPMRLAEQIEAKR
jgi:hypothetical protein